MGVEQAPVEVQTMVAKAFLRDDIDDEDVQYLFNTDTIEQLNDSESNQEVENVNAEQPEGIGAAGFTMRTSRPANNKNFIVNPYSKGLIPFIKKFAFICRYRTRLSTTTTSRQEIMYLISSTHIRKGSSSAGWTLC